MTISSILTNFLGQQSQRGFIPPGANSFDPVTLQLDALISESPEYTGSPTQIQVEDGSTISDHVTLRPLRLSIQGIVTDTPVSLQRQYASPFASPSPSAQAFNFLTKLFNDRLPFDFVGGLTVYESMVITSFSPTSTATTGDALHFNCTMEQVVVVSTDPIVVVAEKSAGRTQSIGTQLLSSMTAPQTAAANKFANSISASVGF